MADETKNRIVIRPSNTVVNAKPEEPKNFDQSALDALFSGGGGAAIAAEESAAAPKAPEKQASATVATVVDEKGSTTNAPQKDQKKQITRTAIWSALTGLVTGGVVTYFACLHLAAPANKAQPEPAPVAVTEQKIFSGSPVNVFAQLQTLDKYTVQEFKLVGYRQEDNEIVPVITVVVNMAQGKDMVIWSRNPNVMSTSLSSLVSTGYKLKFSMVDIPVYSSENQKHLYSYYMFALQPDPQKDSKKQISLIEMNEQTSPILQNLLDRGWKIDQLQGTTPLFQDHKIKYLSTMAVTSFVKD